AGITDPVEIIRILHTRRPLDPLVTFSPPPKSVEELYSNLDADQAGQLMAIAADAMRSGNKDFAEDVAKSLATLTEYCLDPMLDAWIERNHFWPAVIFRNAGATIRDAVVSGLESGT